MKHRSEVKRLEYVQKRIEVAAIIKREERSRSGCNKIGQKLDNDYDGVKKLLYGLAKSNRKNDKSILHKIKDKNGTHILTENNEIQSRWTEYF